MTAQDPKTCPTPDALALLVSGQLSDRCLSSVEQHVANCDQCASVLDSIPDDAKLVRDLRGGIAKGDELDTDATKTLIEQLLSLPVGIIETEVAGQTVTPSGSDKHAFECLRPTSEPGSLGLLGKYRITSLLGSGSMGVVFEAIDPQLNRRIALKVLKPRGGYDDAMRRRFLREARAVAAIKHDNIVSIYEVGEDQKTPYITMELLTGETLESRLRREGKLPTATAIHMAQQIADGLSAAHDQGLIHCDVKPSNVWLERFGNTKQLSCSTESKGWRVKLLDFGLVRDQSNSEIVSSGMLVGTPGYLAPEVVRGESADERSDLFGLGCVLYRMLAGVPAFPGDDALSILFHLATRDPKAITVQGVTLDIKRIVARLVDKSPERRFASASEVSTELAEASRKLRQPKPTSRRLITKTRSLVGAVFVAAAFFVAPNAIRFGTGTGQLVITPGKEPLSLLVKRDGTVQLDAKLTPNKKHSFTFESGELAIELSNATGASQPITVTVPRGWKRLIDVVNIEFEHAATTANQNVIVSEAAPVRSIIGDGRLRHWNWVTSLKMSKDGRQLISGSWDCTAKVWSTETGVELHKFDGHQYEVVDVDIHPDGEIYATAGADNLIKIWDDTKSSEAISISTEDVVYTLRFSNDGASILGQTRNHLYRWQIDGGQLEWKLPSGELFENVVSGFDLDPQSDRIAIRTGSSIRIVESVGRETTDEIDLKGEVASAVQFSPNGDFLAVGIARPNAKVRIFNRQFREVAQFTHPNVLEHVVSIAFSPNSESVAAVFGKDFRSPDVDFTPCSVRVWQIAEQREIVSIVPKVYNTGYFDLAYSEDGSEIYLAGNDGSIRICDSITGSDSDRLAIDSPINTAQASEDGKYVVLGNHDGNVEIIDAKSHAKIRETKAHRDFVFDVAIHPDNSHVVSSGTDSILRSFNLHDDQENTVNHFAGGISFGVNGSVLVAGGRWYEHEIRIWEARSLRRMELNFKPGQLLTTSFAISKNANLLATGGRDGTVLIWDLTTNQVVRELRMPPDYGVVGANAMVISTDNRRVIIGYGHAPIDVGETWIWDIESGKQIAALSGYKRLTASMTVSPDGETLVTGGWRDGAVRFWNLDDGMPMRHFTLGPAASSVRKLFYLNNGSDLAAVGSDGRIHVLNLDK